MEWTNRRSRKKRSFRSRLFTVSYSGAANDVSTQGVFKQLYHDMSVVINNYKYKQAIKEKAESQKQSLINDAKFQQAITDLESALSQGKAVHQ